jgi:hypothetical protein
MAADVEELVSVAVSVSTSLSVMDGTVSGVLPMSSVHVPLKIKLLVEGIRTAPVASASVPPPTVVEPVNVFVPESVQVPAPDFAIESAPVVLARFPVSSPVPCPSTLP